MANIFLKSHKVPVGVGRVTAEKIKAAWLDDTVASTQKFMIGDLACLKSEIKQIDLGSTEVVSNPQAHFIIISDKRGSIWKQAYTTYEAAKAELDRQMAMQHPEVRPQLDWVIEGRGGATVPTGNGFGGF